jgi:hypothetical protein
MKIIIESTDKIVRVVDEAGSVPARLWEGHTASGIYVQCLVTRIAVPLEANQEEFERELKECRPPTIPSVFPLRMIL